MAFVCTLSFMLLYIHSAVAEELGQPSRFQVDYLRGRTDKDPDYMTAMRHSPIIPLPQVSHCWRYLLPCDSLEKPSPIIYIVAEF